MHDYRSTPGKVVIFGAGALACEIYEVLRSIADAGGRAECVSFAVDPGIDAPVTLMDRPVRRDWQALLASDPDISVVVAIGNPAARATAVARLSGTVPCRFARIIHPLVWMGSTVEVGEGTMMFGHVSVTARVSICRHVLVNPGSTIGHDVVLEDFVSLGPSVALAGHVHVERMAELGTAAAVIPHRRIAAGSFVGAGSVVISDVAADDVVAGSPARSISRAGSRKPY